MRVLAVRAGVVCGLALLALAPAAAAQSGNGFHIGVIGDSVAAGFGLEAKTSKAARCAATIFVLERPTGACDSPGKAWPALFARGLTPTQTDGQPVVVDNQAIAGAQTGHLSPGKRLSRRVDRIVAGDPDVILITLGANDLLSDPRCASKKRCVKARLRAKHTERNLRALLRRLDRRTGAEIYITEYYFLDQDLGGAVDAVNSAINSAAAAFDRETVSVVSPPSFHGHGCLRKRKGTWMLPAKRDFCLHPNGAGQQQIANAALTTFAIQNPRGR
ncbi:MAG TPA: SGNH/GDSL hydrolase family protein [Thermoleophilaceae bacterium]|nr:SGNH/GDSL hydrolase family protein [Thermoleophilaceae bacterium]